jgi:competence protein ComEA
MSKTAKYAVIHVLFCISIKKTSAFNCINTKCINTYTHQLSMRNHHMKKVTALFSAALLALGISATSAFAQKTETPKAAAAPAPAAAAAPAAKPAEAKAELIDINSADKKTLMTLKGVGDVTADKIIKMRGKTGYSGKDDLVKKKIVTDKVYADIKDMIIAKQAAKEEKKK